MRESIHKPKEVLVEETRDDEHQHLVPVYMYQLPCVKLSCQNNNFFFASR